MKIYHAPNTRSVRIVWLCEELGLDYELEMFKLGDPSMRDPEYLKINPMARVPSLADGDVTIFESGAILIYLAEKTGRLLPHDVKGRMAVMQWLMFQMGGIGPMQGQAHVFYRYAPEKIEYAIKRYQKETFRLYSVLDTQLEDNEFLAGELSIADMAAWPWVRGYLWAGFEIDELHNLRRWLDVLAERPAFQKGIEVPYKVDRSTTTAEDAREKGKSILI